MPNYDFQCGSCDRVFEAIVPSAQIPAGPPCPTCVSPTARVWLPPRTTRVLPDAVVVYRAPDGSFRFPGETGGASCAKYDHLGYERIEARGFEAVRQLERRLNAHESSQLRRLEERRLEMMEHGERLRRSEVHHGLHAGFTIPETRLTADGQVEYTGRRVHVKLSARGQDALRHAIAINNQRGHRRIGNEAGVHVEAYSMDRSNREGGRRR